MVKQWPNAGKIFMHPLSCPTKLQKNQEIPAHIDRFTQIKFLFL